MAIFRSVRPSRSPELARTLEQLAQRNEDLKRRQDDLEQRIRELEALRLSLRVAIPKI